jgi:hypothetical protein
MATATDTLPHVPSQPDPHPEWLSPIVALRLEADETVPRLAATELDDDEASEELMRAIIDLERLTASTPARSLKGAIAQLELLLYTCLDESEPDMFSQALQGARTTLQEVIG